MTKPITTIFLGQFTNDNGEPFRAFMEIDPKKINFLVGKALRNLYGETTWGDGALVIRTEYREEWGSE